MKTKHEILEQMRSIMPYKLGHEFDPYIHEAMEQYAAIKAPKWVSVETSPDTDIWKQILIDGKHHVLPHCYMNGKWWCYGESHPTNQNVTHYRDFTDLPL